MALEFKISDSIRQIEISAADIKIKSTTQLQLGGNLITMEPTAWQDILKLVGLNQKTIKHLNETMDDGQSGFMLIQVVIKHLAERKHMQLKIVVDLSQNAIIRIVDSAEIVNQIPMETFSNLMEMIASKPGIKVNDPVLMDGGTKVSIQVKWDQDIPLIFKGENISVGKQFTFDMFGSLTTEQLVERLVCTNGMTGIVPAYGKELDINDPGVWFNDIMNSLKNPNKEFIKHYEQLILAAKQSFLSVNEYNMVKATMSHWSRDAEKITKYLGREENWKSEYETRGINLADLTKEQLKNCPTPVNKWDAVNLMTDLSSHVYNSHVDGKTMRDTQKLAGKFLNRAADSDRIVYNVPVFKNHIDLSDLMIQEDK